MVAERRLDGAVRVNALTTDLINRWQAEAPSEVCHTSYRDEGTSKTTEEKEDLEADIAKHTVEKYTEHFFPQMKLEIIDFLPRCLGSVSDGTADCCFENMSAGGIKEFWKKIELPGGADDSYVCTGVKPANCLMPKKTLSEKGLDGGGWIVMNKYMQVETKDGPVWGDSVLCAVGECNYGCIGSPMISYRGEKQTTETLAVSLAVEIVEVPVTQTQEKTRQVANTHVQHVVNTVEAEVPSQFIDKAVEIPVVAQTQISMDQTVQKSIEIPKWLNVVKGVVDSEDLPLNVFRETLLQNKILRGIKKNLVTKYLEMLAEIAELKDAYRKFYEKLVRCMKLGIHENSVDGVEIAELLRFNTSGDEQINLKEYVDRMKEGQNDICYITGENIAVVSSSSFSEDLRKKGCEVLYMVDPMDEYAVHQPEEFNGMRPKSTTKKGLDLGDQDEKKTLEELNMEPETSRKLMKETLGDKVDEVIVSNRMVDSLRAHTASEHGWSTNMKHCAQQRSGSQQHNNYHSKQAMQQRERKEEKGQGERERREERMKEEEIRKGE